MNIVMNQEKFTIKDFNLKFKNDDVCLDIIFQNKYRYFTQCPKCKKSFKYYRITNRKCYECQFCANHIHPLADTIFHKSSTSLKLWFYAIYLFSISKNGVSAKELQRQLGVTYKCAWRIAKQVRILFSRDDDLQIDGTVEIDESYLGGISQGKRGRGAVNKNIVIGAVARKGVVKAKILENVKSSSVQKFILENVCIDSTLITDSFKSYFNVSKIGYNHKTVKHGSKKYVNNISHTNTIEGFWSQLKRSINGTYHSISSKYLQSYIDEFSYRYNKRNQTKHLFHDLVKLV